MRFTSLVLLASALVLPGCATEKARAKKAGADESEWVVLPPATGSNVPRKVRRSETAANAQANGVDTISGQALMDKVRPSGPPPNVKGN